MNTRDMIGEFNRAFGRPIHDTLVMNPSLEDRLLLASILLEEVVETIHKGLGVTIVHECNGGEYSQVIDDKAMENGQLVLKIGSTYDPIETFDGLGDTNVVIHFISHWLGGNLDLVTQEINDSNMSKLASDGTPIINGVTQGYREGGVGVGGSECSELGFRPDLPIGKILKGPNFRKPDIAGVLGLNYGVHIDESTIQPAAQLDHCSEHPDQTTANCTGGYGLAGGGVGMYYICNTCGGIFGKTDDGDDFG